MSLLCPRLPCLYQNQIPSRATEGPTHHQPTNQPEVHAGWCTVTQLVDSLHLLREVPSQPELRAVINPVQTSCRQAPNQSWSEVDAVTNPVQTPCHQPEIPSHPEAHTGANPVRDQRMKKEGRFQAVDEEVFFNAPMASEASRAEITCYLLCP